MDVFELQIYPIVQMTTKAIIIQILIDIALAIRWSACR